MPFHGIRSGQQAITVRHLYKVGQLAIAEPIPVGLYYIMFAGVIDTGYTQPIEPIGTFRGYD